MAKRGRPPGVKLNPRTQEAIRAKIKAGELIEFLKDHALNGGEIDSSRVEAAKFLLTRVISPPIPKDDDGKTPTGPVLISWGT